MVATTDQKARLLDLITGLLEMTRDGNREIESVSAVLQLIKEDPDFAVRLLAKKDGTKSWPVWKTLRVGGVPKDELLKRLKEGSYLVSSWAKNIIGQPLFTTSPEPAEVAFVRAKVRDLGFRTRPTTPALFDRDRLAGLGLDFCQAEDGPHLRLALQDQPAGDLFWVVMEPITDSDGFPGVFYIERYDDGLRWLDAYVVNPYYRWYLEDGIVFRLRK